MGVAAGGDGGGRLDHAAGQRSGKVGATGCGDADQAGGLGGYECLDAAAGCAQCAAQGDRVHGGGPAGRGRVGEVGCGDRGQQQRALGVAGQAGQQGAVGPAEGAVGRRCGRQGFGAAPLAGGQRAGEVDECLWVSGGEGGQGGQHRLGWWWAGASGGQQGVAVGGVQGQ
ncbi:hypothetical protein [Micromonospora maris]|uniref:hypothetical protein n=1 Tax=Micromonospora maris TaxID=1003110 RepID=UPI000206B142|nr:hypothetical protein [Micromonospora maris]AEB44640.1 hypothetical protein VAB18032_17690 [Micromonospora maris AB-18-032]